MECGFDTHKNALIKNLVILFDFFCAVESIYSFFQTDRFFLIYHNYFDMEFERKVLRCSGAFQPPKITSVIQIFIDSFSFPIFHRLRSLWGYIDCWIACIVYHLSEVDIDHSIADDLFDVVSFTEKLGVYTKGNYVQIYTLSHYFVSLNYMLQIRDYIILLHVENAHLYRPCIYNIM